MTTQHGKEKKNAIDSWVRICGAILISASLVALCWSTLAEQRIDKQIHSHTDPIQEALEYQCFLMMENMSDSAVNRANARYFKARSSKTPWGNK